MSEKEQVFKNIFKDNSDKILHLCLSYTGDMDTAHDLLQETFIKVWRNLGSFRNQSQISTWIYRIAINTCLSHLRVEKNRKSDPLEDHHVHGLMEESSSKQEQISQLYKCIALLEENERMIISMVLDEVPYPQIAAVFDITEGNLRVRIHRIKQKLTTIYNQYERF